VSPPSPPSESLPRRKVAAAGRRARRCRCSHGAAHSAAALAALSRFKFSRSIASDISETLSLASWNHRDKPDDPSLEHASMNFKKLPVILAAD
jgi:hypothetical protein